MRSAVQKSGGREVDAIGDEFFAAFEHTRDAVDAAIAIQRAVRGHAWADGADVRVRIGVHTGRPTLGDTGYLGLAVHTVARVCTSAHGGQIVISSAVREAIGVALPDGIVAQSLGAWRLSGLRTSMELLQIHADGLVDEFPPVRPVALAKAP
jgi:class 3 adenylate cyclase